MKIRAACHAEPHFVLCVVLPGPVIPMTGGFFSAGN